MRNLARWATALVAAASVTGVLAGLALRSAPPGAAATVTMSTTVALRQPPLALRQPPLALRQPPLAAAGDGATRAVVREADLLGTSIAQARSQIATVMTRAFARLHASELSVAAERSALSAEQAQLSDEAHRLSGQAAAMVAESATLQKEAAAVRAAQSRLAAEVAAARAAASAGTTAPAAYGDSGSSYGGGGHDN